ncbi:MAG: homocysteine S-methyltransferase family protein, partial [Bdellovibrionales bacterium]|nr:homocysteine S-methyltransferase family protein [Bdellovibrionales bacterium]
GVDFLFASTLPAQSEAQGIARAMADTGIPYIISFVLRGDGTLLDGSLLKDAIHEIDSQTATPPFRYMINCTHSSTFRAAFPHFAEVSERVVGLQANTSARDPLELDGSEELQTEDPQDFGLAMRQLRDDFQIQILGGCCGTDTEHIKELAKQLSDSSQ